MLLDTHAFIWLASDHSKLSAKAKASIQTNLEHLLVSSITALEIGILVKRKRLILPVEPEAFIEKAMDINGIHDIPVDRAIALGSSHLPPIHNDPFDRLIIATAHEHQCPIITKDKTIGAYPGVMTLW